MIPAMVILALVAVIFVVILTNAERRMPVQYAKRVVGRKMYGGQASYIPIKVNMSGVMPIIFASTPVSYTHLDVYKRQNLSVAECYVCPGPTLKRIMPRAQGRAYRILKRTSHMTVVLKEKN